MLGVSGERLEALGGTVRDVLAEINKNMSSFQKEVFDKLEEGWCNETGHDFCPGCATAIDALCKDINITLESVGTALKAAGKVWGEANGKTYNVPDVVTETLQFKCEPANKSTDNFDGLDPEIIRPALNKAKAIQTALTTEIPKLATAAQDETFRGSGQQENLTKACEKVKELINSAIEGLISEISKNTNIAVTNVEEAASATASALEIKE